MSATCRLLTTTLLALTLPLAALAQAHGDAPHAAEPAAAQHAADTAHAGDAGHAAGGHGAEHDAPPLLSFDPGVAIWTVIVFIGLLVVLSGTAWKPILKVLRDREEFITKSIEDARKERANAEKLLADYRAQLEQARREATAIVEEGRRDAVEVRKRIEQEAQREADNMVERAKREIQLATDSAVKQLYDQTAELAVQVAGSIIKQELKAEDHGRLVQESLERMKKTGNVGLN